MFPSPSSSCQEPTMDDRRIDLISKALAGEASRRALLRALLGLGSATAAAVVIHDASSRTAGTRPAIPPPPPPQPTPVPTVSPPTPTPPPCGGFACGLDCCEAEHQCCDG